MFINVFLQQRYKELWMMKRSIKEETDAYEREDVDVEEKEKHDDEDPSTAQG